jgi:hypothetical protein
MKTTLITALLVCTLASICFARHYYTISVYSRGARSVPIAMSTGGSLITNQEVSIAKNQSITFEAPEYWDGSYFRSWSGAVKSEERSITLDKVRGRKSITANYVRIR